MKRFQEKTVSQLFINNMTTWQMVNYFMESKNKKYLHCNSMIAFTHLSLSKIPILSAYLICYHVMQMSAHTCNITHYWTIIIPRIQEHAYTHTHTHTCLNRNESRITPHLSCRKATMGFLRRGYTCKNLDSPAHNTARNRSGRT